MTTRLLIAVLGALTLAPVADAASVRQSGLDIIIEDTAGEANVIGIEARTFPLYPNPVVRVTDALGTLVAGSGCSKPLGQTVYCRWSGTRRDLLVRLGEGDDRLTVSGFRVEVNAGFGDDDVLTDGFSDELTGGPGDDRLDAGPNGFDVITYDGHTEDVTASLLTGVGGAAGERDVLLRAEQLRGGSGDDRLEAGKLPSILNGVDGDDVLIGGPANDELYGAAGHDRLEGGAGTDRLAGENSYLAVSSDVLLGGPGDGDVLIGSKGPDLLDGGPGGRDHASYCCSSFRKGPLRITVDGVADDGEAGEGDQVIGVEDLQSDFSGADHLELAPTLDAGEGRLSAGPTDTLIGSNGRDVISGGAVVRGLGGDDEFQYSQGDVSGGPGRDVLIAQTYYVDEDRPRDGFQASLDDVANDGYPSRGTYNFHSDIEDIVGTRGADELTGSDGPNRLDGGNGDDRLDGRGGADVIVCGDGFDTVVPDPLDTLEGC